MKPVMYIAVLVLAGLVGGCTVHPDGERQERQVAKVEGVPYASKGEDRPRPTLSPAPTSEELVRYALLASPELERRYWEWRAAIEQVPQDGTQATNLAISAGVPITHGSTAFNRTTVTLSNDPMADIVWPAKLSAAAQRALENARAAGLRFQQAKYDLRQRVLDAVYDDAQAAELLRLEQADADLLRSAATAADAAVESGKTSRSTALLASDEADLAENRVAEQRSRLPGLQATLNAVLGRAPTAPLQPPASVPAARAVLVTDEQVIHLGGQRVPELAALDAEVRAGTDGLRLAHLQYIPDVSLSASTDLGGVSQNLIAMVTVPLLKHEAIAAGIAQAEANLRVADRARRQAGLDLGARVVADLATLHDADRQVRLLDGTVLPRATRAVAVMRSEYEVGRTSLSEFLDAQRSLIAVQRLSVEMRVGRERRLADLEAAVAANLAPSASAGQ